MSTETHDLEACRARIRDGMANQGIDVTVSTAPPLIRTAYDPSPLRCPHGTTFYTQPTSEQIAQWAKDGVA